MNEDELSFIKKIKSNLVDGTEQLPAGIQSKLTRMRHEALDAGERRGFFANFNLSNPALRWPSMATACVSVLAVFLYFQTPGGIHPDFEDIDLLASEDPLELYEDLEFYAWLAEEEVSGQGPEQKGRTSAQQM